MRLLDLAAPTIGLSLGHAERADDDDEQGDRQQR
jgi:hypothetical protein